MRSKAKILHQLPPPGRLRPLLGCVLATAALALPFVPLPGGAATASGGGPAPEENLFPSFDESVEDYPEETIPSPASTPPDPEPPVTQTGDDDATAGDPASFPTLEATLDDDARDELFPDVFEGDDARPNQGDELSFQSISVPKVDEIEALIEIAEIQIDTGEYLDAERALKASVKLTENRTSRYDPKLITPLVLLGDARAGMGNYPAALEAYERAVHLTRINEGLHAPAQVEVVYKEAASLAAMGKFEAANDRQEYAYGVLQRAYEPYDEALVPGLFRLAEWYERSYNVFEARNLYEYAREVLERAHGSDDARLIPALRGIADTYRLERFPPYYVPSPESISVGAGNGYPMRGGQPTPVNRYSNGERALRQILKIQEQNPEATEADVVDAVLSVADWNLLFEKYSRAFPLYQYAHKLLSESTTATGTEVQEYLGTPAPLYLPMPPGPKTPPLEMAATPAEGYVELSYSVTERGTVADLKTLGSEPEGLMDIKVRRGMRAARFRPRFEADAPVETTGLTYRYTFHYYPEDSEEDSDAEGQEPGKAGTQSLASGGAG